MTQYNPDKTAELLNHHPPAKSAHALAKQLAAADAEIKRLRKGLELIKDEAGSKGQARRIAIQILGVT